MSGQGQASPVFLHPTPLAPVWHQSWQLPPCIFRAGLSTEQVKQRVPSAEAAAALQPALTCPWGRDAPCPSPKVPRAVGSSLEKPPSEAAPSQSSSEAAGTKLLAPPQPSTLVERAH